MALQIGQIRHVGLFPTRLEDHARFYSEVWGLDLVVKTTNVAFLRGAGPEYFILSLHQGGGRGLHHIAYSTTNEDAVDRAALALRDAGVRIVQEPQPLEEP